MKKIFKRKKKTNESSEKINRKISFSRKKVMKTASLLLFGVVSLSLLFNIIFFSKYQAIRNSAKAAEQKIYDELNQVKDSEIINSHSAVVYAESFLKEYINIPRDKEERVQRLERLEEYFIAGFEVNLEQFEADGLRNLKGLKFIDNQRMDKNKAQLHFIADYEITEITIVEEKTIDENETEVIFQNESPRTINNSIEIVVPVITDGEGFAVYDYPHLTSRDLKAKINLKEDIKSKGEELSATENKKLEKFLVEFFNSYGISDEKLPFMAKVEKGLNNQILQTVSIREAYQDGEKYHAVIDVVYQNSETSLNSSYAFNLQLEKEKNKFFIININ